MTPDRLNHLRGLEPYLRATIRGQDHVVPAVAGAFARAALALSGRERPRASRGRLVADPRTRKLVFAGAS